jgi:hexosaminidase
MHLPILPLPNSIVLHDGETFTGDALAHLTEHDDPQMQNEAYRLVVANDGISVYTSSAAGFFYARQTLLELMSFMPAIPCCDITDAPNYPYRGFMIDCARHFFPVEVLERMIDAAAALKLNVFHWHLSDDQGFRFGSERFPELTAIGSVRPSSDFDALRSGEYGGFYTKADIRHVVDFCAARYISVIPEIDLPGHVSAILAAHPELSCSGENVQIKTRGGIFDDVLCTGKESVYEFVFELIDELSELFPDKRIHIGGDEVRKGQWRSCPDCQRRKKELGLKNETALQGYFTRRIAEHLHAHGKTPIVWNDALKGTKLPDYVLVQYWMGSKKNTAAHVKHGGDAIYSGCLHCYFDYPYGITPLFKTYRCNPQSTSIPKVSGVECTFWSEYILDEKRLSYLAFPRIAAIAETGWAKPDLKNKADFLCRVKELRPYFEQYGIRFAPEEDWNMSVHRSMHDIAAHASRITGNKNRPGNT